MVASLLGILQGATSPDAMEAQYPPSGFALQGDVVPQPSSNKPGNGWNHYTNVTGLVTGVTKLGDELSLLYTPGEVNRSIFGNSQSWLWNGKTFAKSWSFGRSHATIISGRCLILRQGMATCTSRASTRYNRTTRATELQRRSGSGNTVGAK